MKTVLAIAAVVAAIATASPAAWADTFITDTLAPGGGHASPYDQHQQGFITDTLAPGGGPAAPVVTVRSGGFSWSDAGIGAGAATGGLVALLGATLLLARQRQRLAI